MAGRYTFQEQLLHWSKKHKKKLTLHTSVLAAVSAAVLIASSFWSPAQVPLPDQNEDAVLTASFTGDLMFSRHIEDVIDRRGIDYLFKYTDPYFEISDFATGSFKQPVIGPDSELEPSEDQTFTFSTGPETVDALAALNFKSLSIANNNSHDYGYLGFRATGNFFDDHEDIDSAGYMSSTDDLEDGIDHTAYYEHDGMTIATLGVTDVVQPNAGATTYRPGVMTFDDPGVVTGHILQASEEADLVIVHAHWGEQYDSQITERQRDLAHAMSRAGADVIIGHYPHVLAPVEIYNDTVIFYSLGNFIFDQGWTRTKQTALAQYRLYEDGRAEVELIPHNIREGQPRPVANWSPRRFAINSMLTKNLEDDAWQNEDGNVVIQLNHERVLEEGE